MDKMDKEIEGHLIKEQIIYESDKESIIDNLKKWGRRLPPVLAGTIATAITSNPTFIGVGSILLILEEIGFNLKDLIEVYKSKTGYKLNPEDKRDSRIIKINTPKSQRKIIPLDKALENFHYDLDITCSIYEIEQVVTDEELDIILKEIDKYIVSKGYEYERSNIFNEYYKITISKVVNDESGAVDFFDFMNSLKFLVDIGLCEKKEYLELAKNVVKNLNESFPNKENIKM